MKNNFRLLNNDEFDILQNIILSESGIFFDKTKNNTLSFAVNERCEKVGLSSYSEYLNFIAGENDSINEIQLLIEEVTVGETYFFRNKPQFDALINHVIPEIIEKKRELSDKTIRIWSAGCSRGDEAYSISIALIEHIPDYEQWDISILGTDINNDVLKVAVNGIYNNKDISRLPKDILNKYFIKKDKNYLLAENVKKTVKFKYHNLSQTDTVLDEMVNLDIIFCRNVTIYFDISVTKKLIDLFYQCLNFESFLFLGHAETLWYISNKFETLEFKDTFVYKKIEKGKISNISNHVFSWSPDKGKMFTELDLDVKVEKTRKTIKKKSPKKSTQNISGITPQKQKNENKPTEIDLLLQKGISLANKESYEESEKIFISLIDKDLLFLDAYYFLALLYLKTERYADAETYFKKVLYLDRDVVLAHFYLGRLYYTQNRMKKAKLEFNNVINYLKKNGPETEIRFGDGYNINILLSACEKNINKLASY